MITLHDYDRGHEVLLDPRRVVRVTREVAYRPTYVQLDSGATLSVQEEPGTVRDLVSRAPGAPHELEERVSRLESRVSDLERLHG